MAEAYLPNCVEALGPGALSMQLAVARLGSTTVGQLEYGRRTRLVSDEARHIQRPDHRRGFVEDVSALVEAMQGPRRASAGWCWMRTA